MLDRFFQTIDWVSEKSGKVVSFLFFPGWLLVLYSVITRYFFNKPSIFAGEYAKYLFAVYFVVGGAYCLQNKSHIRVDIIYNLMAKKTQLFIEFLVVFPIAFFFIFPFIWHGTLFTWTAIKFLETDPPPTHIILFPIKIMVPIAGILLFLQLFSDLHKYYASLKEEKPHVD